MTAFGRDDEWGDESDHRPRKTRSVPGASGRNAYTGRRSSAGMDRQQIIAILFVVLMVGSSVVYGASVLI